MDSIEAFTNATVGLVVGFLAARYLFPFWGLEATSGQAIGLTAMFFTLSAVRVYVLRKVFRGLE